MPFRFTEEKKERMLLDGLSRVYIREYLKYHHEIAEEAERFVREVLSKTSVKELFAVLDVGRLLITNLKEEIAAKALDKINTRYGVDYKKMLNNISVSYNCLNIVCPQQGYFIFDLEEEAICPHCDEVMNKQ